MRLPGATIILTLVCFSESVFSAMEKTEICYPKDNQRAKFCHDVYYDASALPFSLIEKDDMENLFSGVTKYGLDITRHIDNPIIKRVADRVTEAVSAAGYGPMLALARLALTSRLNGGSGPDPIETAVRVILDRIDEAEQRIISRIDAQFRQAAIDQFNGLNTLYQIYNTADSIEKRATYEYRSRLAQVDNNLDILIEYFENDRFKGKRVQNFQMYINIVALRLAVLAEMERLALYSLYGRNLEPHYAEYEATLKWQYQIVLDGVFDYVNLVVAESDEWNTESDKRFGSVKLGQYFHVVESNPRFPSMVVKYSSVVRPRLHDVERAYYDSTVTEKTGRSSITWIRGHYMDLQEASYTFSGVEYAFHLTRASQRTGAEENYYGSQVFDVERFDHIHYCAGNIRAGKKCPSDMWFKQTQDYARQLMDYHKDRARKQFLYIYYRPVQEILDQWWGCTMSPVMPGPATSWI